jgi:hypothetical protein
MCAWNSSQTPKLELSYLRNDLALSKWCKIAIQIGKGRAEKKSSGCSVRLPSASAGSRGDSTMSIAECSN